MDLFIWILTGALVALLIWWFAPILVVRRFSLANDKERAELEDAYRKTASQAIGGIAVIATFVWTFAKDRETIDLARAQFKTQTDQFSEQQKQSSRQFANQQFIEGAKLLKESAIGTRVAGLYAIEQIALSRSEYREPAIHAVVGFIKSAKSPDSKNKDNEFPQINADIQSAINILATLSTDRLAKVDLRGAYLVQASFTAPRDSQAIKTFRGANFKGAILYGSNMSDLDLTGAMFDGSRMADWEAYASNWEKLSNDDYENTRDTHVVNFNGSTLINVGFDNVPMGGATFENACLANAKFWKADLSRASFENARLGDSPDCNFEGHNKAHFYQAVLIDTNFEGVDVGGVNFGYAILSGADFSKALHVETANFEKACGNERTRFPASFAIKLTPCQKPQ